MNVPIPYIEAKESKDGNLQAFEVVNAKGIPENMVWKKQKINEAAMMNVKCFLRHGFPFQYDPTTWMLERINMIKVKYVDKRFGLGFKPRKVDYTTMIEIKKDRRWARIEGINSKEDGIEILPIHIIFPQSAHVIKVEDELESLRKEIDGTYQ